MAQSQTASGTATITIASGPDAGKSFEVGDALVNIGRNAENEIALSDRSLPGYQLSIVRRNDRFAIFTPLQDSVQVDGRTIPPEQWAWLPARAKIQLSSYTALRFEAPQNSAGSKSKESGGQRKVARFKGTATANDTHRERPRREGEESTVARFIPTKSSDALSQWTAEGRLPQLTLEESQSKQKDERKRSGTNPTLLYIVLGLSLLMSLGMLFFEPQNSSVSRSDVAQAEREIEEFYGPEGEPLEPYQEALREARRARSRQDKQAELNAYARVLRYLDDERLDSYTGLTGNPERDERLRRLIGILMRR